jgi:hypothetical protein
MDVTRICAFHHKMQRRSTREEQFSIFRKYMFEVRGKLHSAIVSSFQCSPYLVCNWQLNCTYLVEAVGRSYTGSIVSL